MTEVVLFHHIRGLTPGVMALADAWRSAGHSVQTPDLFEGRTFASLTEGSAYADEVGLPTLLERAVACGDGLAPDVVYAGISMGAVCAEYLALTRPGARGVVMLESAVAPAAFAEFGAPARWPTGVAFQIHGMDKDRFFAGEGDIDVAFEMVAELPAGELFLYPGTVHLFCDASLATYDRAAAALLVERVNRFLDVVAA
jgi:dienelactone hydrolase